MKTLILTEKPSVAMDFAKALQVAGGKKDGYLEDNNYIITWAVGHLVELLEPEDYDAKWKKWNLNTLPIIPDQFRYKPISKTQRQLGIIQRLLQKPVDKIVIATDAGREGEVIARTILLYSGFNDNNKLNRFWTSQALTSGVVREGMKSLKTASEYDRLWKAGQSRQIADWLIGMNCSRAATVKMNDLFSIGRVQTAVLSLLADRRKERENFKPEPYWVLRASFSNDKGSWWGTWFKGEETRFVKENDAKQVQSGITGHTGKVLSVKKQKKKQAPPFLYSLTDLQRDGNSKFGFSAKKTLEIAQTLYENKKCLSYPRTDSKVLGSKNVAMTQNLVKQLSQSYPEIFAGVEPNLINLSNKRVFNDAKLTDHHALIPLKALPGGGSGDEKKIYDLVLKRFAAAFHPDCEYEQTEIVTQVQDEKFRTRGRRILRPGWQVVYEGEDKQKKSGKDEEEEPENLPPLAKGDPAKVGETKLEKKKTTPPPEYTEALLLKDMTNPGKYVSEDDLKKIYRGDTGLGTQSTRSQIIETLLSRKYAERKKKTLLATDKGSLLINTLRQFKVAGNLASPEETARWEKQLNLIAQGKGSDKTFLDAIRKFVEQSVEEFNKTIIKVREMQNMGKCLICGGKIIEGKRGFGCSNWRKEDGACRFVVWKNISGRMITPSVVTRLIDKKEAGPLDGFVSEDNERFSGMLRLVKEDAGWQVKVEPADTSSEKKPPGVLGECPACGGDVVESPKAYGCANWREKDGRCKFTVWKIIAQKEISEEVAIQLIEKGITEKLEGFKSRKGNTFSASLKIGKDETGLLRVVFDFGD